MWKILWKYDTFCDRLNNLNYCVYFWLCSFILYSPASGSDLISVACFAGGLAWHHHIWRIPEGQEAQSESSQSQEVRGHPVTRRKGQARDDARLNVNMKHFQICRSGWWDEKRRKATQTDSSATSDYPPATLTRRDWGHMKAFVAVSDV